MVAAALLAWCGLVAGLLEVGITVFRKRTFDLTSLLPMSRHFLWLTPLANLVIFLVVGVLLSLVVMCGRRRGSWLAARLLGALTLVPPLWAAFPAIYGAGGLAAGARNRGAGSPSPRAAWRRVSAVDPVQLSCHRRSRANLGGVSLGAGRTKGVARRGAAAASAGFPERARDRA